MKESTSIVESFTLGDRPGCGISGSAVVVDGDYEEYLPEEFVLSNAICEPVSLFWLGKPMRI